MGFVAADVDAHGGRSVLLLAIERNVEDLLHRAPLHGRSGLTGRSRVPLVEGPPIAGHDLGDIMHGQAHGPSCSRLAYHLSICALYNLW